VVGAFPARLSLRALAIVRLSGISALRYADLGHTMAHVQAPEAGWDNLSLAAALERFASDRSMCNGTRQAWGRLDFAQLLMQPNPPG